jgi:D-alanine-D-alanine ligase
MTNESTLPIPNLPTAAARTDSMSRRRVEATRRESTRHVVADELAVAAPPAAEAAPAYQIAIPGFLSESRVQVRPRLVPRRPLRPRDPGEADVVVLYNVALGLERGRPEDIVSDAETEEVACRIGDTLREHVRSIELAPVWDDLGDVLRRYDPTRHVVFNLCESLGGRAWSEAEVPRLMRAAGFLHTGASFMALRRAGSKLITKRSLEAAGLDTPAYEVIRHAGRRPTHVSLPAIVKPVAEHGSCGITLASVVDDRKALGERIDACIRDYRQPALVEEFIIGRELNVALWGNGFPEVLPIAEIAFCWTQDPLQQIVTFSGKWHKGSIEARGTPGVCPAELGTEVQDRVEAAAVLAYQELGVRGFARVDMRLRDDLPYVLEVNIHPDLAPDAGFFRSARAAGHSYASMLLYILRLAFAPGS